MNKGDYTITKSSFTYYLNTKADKTIAYGPGLLTENAIGAQTTIVIQARNKNDQNRESGSDEFIVTIRNPAKIKKIEEEAKEGEKHGKKEEESDEEGDEEEIKKKKEAEKAAAEKAAAEQAAEGEEAEVVDPSLVPFVIKDNDDGSYFIQFTSEEEAVLEVDIKFKDENNELHAIRGNPFRCGFAKGIKASNNDLAGSAVMNYISKQLKDIQEFIENTKDNIEIRNKNIRENVSELINVMVNLEKVRVKNEDDVLTLDTVEEMLNFLKKKDFGKDSDIKKCKKLQEEWKNLAKMAQAVKKDIQNPVKTESDKTKENIKKFEEITLKEYANSLKKESFFVYKTGV